MALTKYVGKDQTKMEILQCILTLAAFTLVEWLWLKWADYEPKKKSKPQTNQMKYRR